MMRKVVKTMLLAGGFSAVLSFAAFAGQWKQNNTGWWYQYNDGSYASSGIKSINGVSYYFDNNGYMKTGWVDTGANWYYFNGDGSMALGWAQVNGKWYYLDPANGGAMHRYWLDLDGKRYYMDNSGAMQTGIFSIDANDDADSKNSQYAYQADDTGALITNKVERHGKDEIRHDELGRMTFRNEQTKRDAKRYGKDAWVPFRSDSGWDDYLDSDEHEIKETKDMLWDKYKKDVKRAKRSERDQALQDWKDEVKDELGGYLNSSQIEEFIQEVIKG